MTDRLSLCSVLRRKEATAGQAVPDDYLLVALDSGRYFGLGEVGGDIWQRLDGTRSLGDIAADIAEHYAAPLPVVSEDLLELARQLIDSGLAELAAEG